MSTARASYRRSLDTADVPKIDSGGNLWAGFTAFKTDFVRATRAAGCIAYEELTNMPFRGDKTRLERLEPNITQTPMPDGWDMDMLVMADEMPELYPKPTDKEDLVAYNKWMAYARLTGRHRHYGLEIWTKIRDRCDDNLRDIIGGAQLDETNADAPS